MFRYDIYQNDKGDYEVEIKADHRSDHIERVKVSKNEAGKLAASIRSGFSVLKKVV